MLLGLLESHARKGNIRRQYSTALHRRRDPRPETVIFAPHPDCRFPLTIHETYLHRCLELARQAAGYTAPNPLVGAVLVHQGRIIGEGFHRQYGGPHAEPNCIDSVAEADQAPDPDSLPCTYRWSLVRILAKHLPAPTSLCATVYPEVVIGGRDPFVEVDGKGIEKLKAAGIKVTVGSVGKSIHGTEQTILYFSPAAPALYHTQMGANRQWMYRQRRIIPASTSVATLTNRTRTPMAQ